MLEPLLNGIVCLKMNELRYKSLAKVYRLVPVLISIPASLLARFPSITPDERNEKNPD
jgi:hypothetical protein